MNMFDPQFSVASAAVPIAVRVSFSSQPEAKLLLLVSCEEPVWRKSDEGQRASRSGTNKKHKHSEWQNGSPNQPGTQQISETSAGSGTRGANSNIPEDFPTNCSIDNRFRPITDRNASASAAGGTKEM